MRTINYLPPPKSDSSSPLNPNTPPSSSSCDSDSLFSNFDSASPSSTSSLLSSPISPSTSTSSSEANPKKPKRTYTRKTTVKKDQMIDSSRIMLCMFVMSILFFNPFNLILSPSDPNELAYQTGQYSSNKPVNSRVLNAIDLEIEHFNKSNPNLDIKPRFNGLYLFGWFLNAILITFCLFRVYVSGDPRIDSDKTNESRLSLNYQKACRNFQRKEYEQAFSRFSNSLKELGQSAPSTKSELLVGILWQLIKLAMDYFYIGKILSKLSVWIYGPENFTAYRLSAIHHFELHKFAYLNLESEKDFHLKIATTSSDQKSNNTASMYSYLIGIYFMLAAINMSSVYMRSEAQKDAKNEYNNYEMYFSMILYLKFYLPLRVSTFLTKYFFRQKILKNQGDQVDTSKMSKLQTIKALLNKRIFIEFLEDFDNKADMNFDNRENNDITWQQKSLNLMSYKRRIFSTNSALNESNATDSTCDISVNSISCDYIVQKFQEFLFFKMADQIINQASFISTEKILKKSSSLECQLLSSEENCELEDVDDQHKFSQLVELYEENLDYFYYCNTKLSKLVIQETQYTLVKFLNMTNRWKLRKFDFEIRLNELKNSYKR